MNLCKICQTEEHDECWEIEPDLECSCCIDTMIAILTKQQPNR